MPLLTKISPEEAAELLGISAEGVRQKMQIGVLPIGTCCRSGAKNYEYLIYLEWVRKYAQYGPYWQRLGERMVLDEALEA